MIVLLLVLMADLDRFTDNSLNYTQRSEACLALRGDKRPEVIEAMRVALPVTGLQACAGANLRLAGATDILLAALTGPDGPTRALAARELGTTGNPKFLAPLRKAADDPDILVASNAIEGLVRYSDHSSAPQLREIATKGGVLTALALEALIAWNDKEVLPIARKLIAGKDPGDQLLAIRAIGVTGDKSDLPKLEEFAKDDTSLTSGARGFGLMPTISIARAAKTAIQNINTRSGAK